MDFFYHQFLEEKIQWMKEKGLWFVILIICTITISAMAFALTTFFLFLVQPQQYKAVVYPEFQTKSNDDFKLVSVLENSFLKAQFCMIEGFSYTGFSLNQDQYCNFNYQQLPIMNKAYDIVLYGLNSIYVRYAKVCLLKYPYKYKQSKLSEETNQTLNKEKTIYLRNRYICQKYRAYSKIHLIHDLKADQLIFVEIQLQLSQKGYQSLQFLNLKLQFTQERSKVMRLLIDHYYWIAGLTSLGMAAWIAIISTIIGMAVIVKTILNQKEQRQEQQIKRLQKESYQQRQSLMKLKRQKRQQKYDDEVEVDHHLVKQKLQ